MSVSIRVSTASTVGQQSRSRLTSPANVKGHQPGGGMTGLTMKDDL